MEVNTVIVAVAFTVQKSIHDQTRHFENQEEGSSPFLLFLKYIESFLLRAVNETFSEHYSLAQNGNSKPY